MVHRETFLKIYLKLNEPTVDSFRTARSLAATHCEPVSLNTGRLAACTDELERNTQKLGNTYIEICKEVFKLESSTLAEAAYPQNCMVEQPRNQRISITSLILRHFSVGRRASRPRYGPVQTFPRKLCCGSKKWRGSNQWTISRRISQSEGVFSRMLRCWMRRLRLP